MYVSVRASRKRVRGRQPISLSGALSSIFSGAPQGPEVAFDGTNYLLAWTSYGTGPAYFYAQTLGVRLRRDGTFVDDAPFVIDRTDSTGLSDLVFGGAGFLGGFIVERLRARGVREVFTPRSAEYDLVPAGRSRDETQAMGTIDGSQRQQLFSFSTGLDF